MPAVVTGYYEPTIAASERPNERFRHPLLKPPPRSAPRGPTRREIETGALAGRGLEMYWVEDPIELYFLQIQGSGRLRLTDGRTVRVGFAGANGWPYRSIGKLLIERGVFSSGQGASAPAIKRYLRSQPRATAAEVMRENPRYVFFRRLDVPPHLGPPGALGAPLVPFRSVAVDPRDVPLGSVGFLTVPLDESRILSAFVVAMDTGAAIVGRGRLDLFLGEGAGVERMAGELHARGRIIWLTAHPRHETGVR
jgi:membrane-bound lytic murein transglycosylase A